MSQTIEEVEPIEDNRYHYPKYEPTDMRFKAKEVAQVTLHTTAKTLNLVTHME